MAHDIFPFVNVFVVTNILTRNYHEFLHFLILSQYIIQSMIKEKELILIIEGDGNNIRKDRVLNDLKIKFSSYKIPDKIEIIKRFERTVTGKIKRKV